jgi:hypothetical protein
MRPNSPYFGWKTGDFSSQQAFLPQFANRGIVETLCEETMP